MQDARNTIIGILLRSRAGGGGECARDVADFLSEAAVIVLFGVGVGVIGVV